MYPDNYPPDVQRLLSGLMERNIILSGDPVDEMFINFLYSQKYDEDYIDSIRNDRPTGI